MNIEMLDNTPKKRVYSVSKGDYVRILASLLESDKPALAVHCESVEDAKKRTVGLRNSSIYNKMPVKVWRRGQDVFVEKLEDNSNEDK